MPAWVQPTITTLLGAVVGFGLGLVSDMVKLRHDERRRAQRLQTALYHELGEIYCYVLLATTGSETGIDKDKVVSDIALVQMDAYRFAKSQPDIFYLLPEALELDHIFSALYFAQNNTDKRMQLAFAQMFPIAVDSAIQNKKIRIDILKVASRRAYGHIMKRLNMPER